ncbi:MAG: LytTR family DNA-binding domain-containing protein [Bacteroidia bacterium]|jgi:DNA-binding LytR/AlgR family response regulator|nr:LytTR family DNA-binding domain-containing protein [Bacteroidia bacterium]
MDQPIACLIADDEAPAHLVIESHLTQVPGFYCAAHAYNGAGALSMIGTGQFGLVFLDIQMPVISGLELLRNLTHRPAVIITTAYENFAFESYQLDVADYLLKPVSLPRFLKSIQKVRPLIQSAPVRTSLQFAVKGETITVLLAELSHIESMGNYIRLHYMAARIPLTVYGSLREIARQLHGTGFIQIHKSFVVNTAAISHTAENSVQLLNTTILPVGRRYKLLLEQNMPHKKRPLHC